MIKSKKLKKYYGRKGYADGIYGSITKHSVIEDADGLKEEFVVDSADGLNRVSNSVVVMERLNFFSKNNVIIAIAVVDGRTYVGHSVLNPADGINIYAMGRKLALARALRDADGEDSILDDITCLNEGDGLSDDEEDECDEEDEGYVGECEYCGQPLYEGDNYIEDADGNLYCDNQCKEDLEKELAEEETEDNLEEEEEAEEK